MPGFSKARLDHFAAIRPQAEYCGVCVRTYGKESGSAMCKVCCEYPHKSGGRVEPLEEDNEAINPTLKSVGVKPTPEEVELHNATHMPYRSWCKFCVAG